LTAAQGLEGKRTGCENHRAWRRAGQSLEEAEPLANAAAESLRFEPQRTVSALLAETDMNQKSENRRGDNHRESVLVLHAAIKAHNQSASSG
jgi:hypothetical protein